MTIVTGPEDGWAQGWQGGPRLQPSRARAPARIRQLRAAVHLTLEDLAASAGVSVTYLGQTESGRSAQPSVLVLWRIADALDITLEQLAAADPSSAS